MLTPNQWVASDLYGRFFNQLAKPPETRVALEDTPYIVVSGMLIPGQSGQLDGVYDVSRPVNYNSEAGQGPHRIELLDASNQVLFTRHFEGSAVTGETLSQELGFIEMIPRPAGLARVALWDDAQKLDELAVSENAPTVDSLTSLDGQNIEAPTSLSWIASDSDGDTLTYAVEYSADGGSTWLPLNANLADTSYTLDPIQLPGTTQGKIRVRASDGLNTGERVSDGEFAVPEKDPTAIIWSPIPGRHRSGAFIELVGSGYDQEDGPLPDNAFVWSVDDDQAGIGSLVTLYDVPDGEHVITLTVTDSTGRTTTEEVTITVTPFPRQLFVPVTVGGS